MSWPRKCIKTIGAFEKSQVNDDDDGGTDVIVYCVTSKNSRRSKYNIEPIDSAPLNSFENYWNYRHCFVLLNNLIFQCAP